MLCHFSHFKRRRRCLHLFGPLHSCHFFVPPPYVASSSYSSPSLLWCISPRWCLWELVARLNRIAAATADMTPLNKPNISPHRPLFYFLPPLSCTYTSTVILSHLFTSSFPLLPGHSPRERTFHVSPFLLSVPFCFILSCQSDCGSFLRRSVGAGKKPWTKISPVGAACAIMRLIWLDNDWLYCETIIQQNKHGAIVMLHGDSCKKDCSVFLASSHPKWICSCVIYSSLKWRQIRSLLAELTD